jgi:hypothetical protein
VPNPYTAATAGNSKLNAAVCGQSVPVYFRALPLSYPVEVCAGGIRTREFIILLRKQARPNAPAALPSAR